jgi:hypothetical protein
MSIPMLVLALLVSFAPWASAQTAAAQPRTTISPVPPINVTVTMPERTAAEAARDDQRRSEDLALQRQQIAFNEQIASYTRIQTGVVAASLLLSAAALWIAWSQATIALAAKRNMDRQTEHMEGQLVATKKSADAAVLALEHADRPWIRVSIKDPSLMWSDTEGLQITATVEMSNIGRSVAEQVRIEVDYVPDSGGEAVQRQRELADAASEPRLLSMANSLFPGESKSIIYTVGTQRERTNQYWRKMMPEMLDKEPGDRILSAKYIGCIGYRYGTSDRWHYTFWGYDLVTHDNRHLTMQMATGKITNQPYLLESSMGNLNRAT